MDYVWMLHLSLSNKLSLIKQMHYFLNEAGIKYLEIMLMMMLVLDLVRSCCGRQE
jgi:hypothetical protein